MGEFNFKVSVLTRYSTILYPQNRFSSFLYHPLLQPQLSTSQRPKLVAFLVEMARLEQHLASQNASSRCVSDMVLKGNRLGRFHPWLTKYFIEHLLVPLPLNHCSPWQWSGWFPPGIGLAKGTLAWPLASHQAAHGPYQNLLDGHMSLQAAVVMLEGTERKPVVPLCMGG
eukprot:5660856-Amphidinium_carterae.1